MIAYYVIYVTNSRIKVIIERRMKQEELKRGAGILMPVSSLPSLYGIGTFGRAAYDFVDKLVLANQKYWQVLPLGRTSYGDSPYASFSAFAGNPYFIDLGFLIQDRLITKEYVESFKWNEEDEYVDYGIMYESRIIVLKEAFRNSKHKETQEFKEFLSDNNYWLDDYCMYSACKRKFDNIPWSQWEEDIKFRKSEKIDELKEALIDDIEYCQFEQYIFYKQWTNLKNYANSKHIQIIGDIPIYVAMDSSDVWANTELFQLNDDLEADIVAGVPPDAFSDLGQKWGNPIYNWTKMEKDDFSWWQKRMKHSSKLYDIIRIDHFIGLTKYYTIPADNDDARIGKWEMGPGIKIIEAINNAIGNKKIIAEDLGVKIPEVEDVLEQSGYPGMKVLEFAFDGNRLNEHLPYLWTKNTVAYGGTHDNNTLVGYFENLQGWELGYIREYLECRDGSVEDIVDKLFSCAYQSVANVVIFQMQDVLKVGDVGRMNIPSTMGTNWKWRMLPNQFDGVQIERLRYLADIYGR